MAIFIFLGGPGSGKGTQASIFEKEFSYKKISTGDILRSASLANTKTGQDLRNIMAEGKFVPDDIVVKIIEEEIKQNFTKHKGFILDGFPRTVVQAEALDEMLKMNEIQIGKVFYFKMNEDKLIARVSGRYSCANCLEGYHKKFKMPKTEGVCDICGGKKFIKRADDNAQTMVERLRKFSEMTAPLLPYYADKSLLVKLDADRSISEVNKDIAFYVK